MKIEIFESPDIIAAFMKSLRVCKFEGLNTRSSEEDRYQKQILKDKENKE